MFLFLFFLKQSHIVPQDIVNFRNLIYYSLDIDQLNSFDAFQ